MQRYENQTEDMFAFINVTAVGKKLFFILFVCVLIAL